MLVHEPKFRLATRSSWVGVTCPWCGRPGRGTAKLSRAFFSHHLGCKSFGLLGDQCAGGSWRTMAASAGPAGAVIHSSDPPCATFQARSCRSIVSRSKTSTMPVISVTALATGRSTSTTGMLRPHCGRGQGRSGILRLGLPAGSAVLHVVSAVAQILTSSSTRTNVSSIKRGRTRI